MHAGGEGEGRVRVTKFVKPDAGQTRLAGEALKETVRWPGFTGLPSSFAKTRPPSSIGRTEGEFLRILTGAVRLEHSDGLRVQRHEPPAARRLRLREGQLALDPG